VASAIDAMAGLEVRRKHASLASGYAPIVGGSPLSVNHTNYPRVGERVTIHTVISQVFLIPASSRTISAPASSSALNGQCTNSVTAEITARRKHKICDRSDRSGIRASRKPGSTVPHGIGDAGYTAERNAQRKPRLDWYEHQDANEEHRGKRATLGVKYAFIGSCLLSLKTLAPTEAAMNPSSACVADAVPTSA
jgi:hypothetical protein